MPGSARRTSAIGLALVGGMLAACAAPRSPEATRGSLDLWPFVVRDARPVAGIATTRVAGPFYESWTRDSEADPEAHETGFRWGSYDARRSIREAPVAPQ